MQPYLQRIAELHYQKRQTKQPLSDIETTEWIESLTANMKSRNKVTAAEHVLGFLWERYCCVGVLCKVERQLWTYAMDKNLDRYWNVSRLYQLSKIAAQIGDKKWFDEIQSEISKIEQCQ